MARRFVFRCLALVAAAVACPASFGQDNLLEDLYGRGVHAYFSHNYKESHELLSAAIKAGSRDPRCYYFRGLSDMRLGRPEDAKADFLAGAELEVAGIEPIPVGRSLERIQGSDRLAIENSRRTARLAAHKTETARDGIRLEPTKNAEPEVLRNPARVAPIAPASGEADPNDPFGPASAPAPLDKPANAKPVAPPPPPPPATPAPAPAAAAVDPFAEPAPAKLATPPKPAPAPAPAPAPLAADPFAEPAPAKPAAPPKPAPAPAPTPPAADPFAEPAPAKPATPAVPAPAPAPGAPAPAPAEPADAKPAAPVLAPTDKPAAPAPAAADPFAEPAPAKPAAPAPGAAPAPPAAEPAKP